MKALVEAGADYLQLDEPSAAIIEGSLKDWIALMKRAFDGVKAKRALHVCFGNLLSRPRGKRTYRWMFPGLLDVPADQFVCEIANREMVEPDIYQEFDNGVEFGAGVIDVKSFYVEKAEDVAEHIRLMLKYVPAEKLYINPDCGFFPVPRWLANHKLKTMVEGAKIVRRELEGNSVNE